MKGNAAYRTTLTGMLFALAIVLGWLESFICSVIALPPGIRLGLSNTVVLFAVLDLGVSQALFLAVLKAGFSLLTRGPIAALLSLGGGVLSVLVMALIARSRRISFSVGTLSAFGGTAHNTAQLLLASVIIQNPFLIYYFPVLLVCGILTGLLTGTVFKAAQPYLRKAGL